MNESDARQRERLRWRARRGLLENDLLLKDFLDQKLETLPTPDLELLDKLLRLNDNDLLDLLMGRNVCGDAGLDALIANIRSCAPGYGGRSETETKAQER